MGIRRIVPVKSFMEKEYLVICLEGRIDSNNAPKLEAEIQEIVGKHPGMPLCLDAEDLQYCSSAGLRVLLRLSKKQSEPLTIRNVSLEVYDILETTGFTMLLNVRKKRRRLNLDGCDIIGKGAVGTVYRLDEDTIVKLYRTPDMLPVVEAEQEKARKAFLQGIPTAIPFDIVQVGDLYGSVFEMVKAKSGNDLVVEEPERLTEIIGMVANFLKSLHAVELKHGEFPDARQRFLEYVEKAESVMPEWAAARLKELLKAMPENNHVIHGDVHLNNIMYSDDSLMLIDMDTVCLGDPVFEFAGLYAAYIAFNEDEPDNTLRFFGIDRETASRIVQDTLLAYLGNPDEAVFQQAMEKVRLAGLIRFMFILSAKRSASGGELNEIRIRHSVEHLEECLPLVSSLEL